MEYSNQLKELYHSDMNERRLEPKRVAGKEMCFGCTGPSVLPALISTGPGGL